MLAFPILGKHLLGHQLAYEVRDHEEGGDPHRRHEVHAKGERRQEEDACEDEARALPRMHLGQVTWHLIEGGRYADLDPSDGGANAQQRARKVGHQTARIATPLADDSRHEAQSTHANPQHADGLQEEEGDCSDARAADGVAERLVVGGRQVGVEELKLDGDGIRVGERYGESRGRVALKEVTLERNWEEEGADENHHVEAFVPLDEVRDCHRHVPFLVGRFTLSDAKEEPMGCGLESDVTPQKASLLPSHVTAFSKASKHREEADADGTRARIEQAEAARAWKVHGDTEECGANN
mmetsp:Transcript_63031/g.124558  ORF Transcript_63031/g.124558 Transcript_63031/m.124558 type:complete len:296 (-) Transcript_63031:472-1359(-)